MSTRISQTWLASQTGAIAARACARMARLARPRAGEHLPEAGAEVGAAEHGVGDQADEQDDERRLGERHDRACSGRGLAASRRSTHQTATASPA